MISISMVLEKVYKKSSLNTRQSWRLINEISGRKGAKRGLIKGNSKEERIKLWYKDFNDLLGKKLQLPGEEEDDIPPILKNLGINDEPFTMPELTKAKKCLCWKSSWS